MQDHVTARDEFPELPFGEQFLLWALRQWVRAFKSKGGPQETLRRGFRLAGIEAGHGALDELLTIVSLSATTSIDVRCPNCAGISVDERIFIATIAALQRSDFSESARLLGFWISPSGVRMAQTPAAQLAQLMAAGGLALRPRIIARADREEESASDRAEPGHHAATPPTLH